MKQAFRTYGRIVLTALLLVATPTGAQEPPPETVATDFPLQPPNTSSPQATMGSFLNNMQEAHRQIMKGLEIYMDEPGWYQSPKVKKEFARAFIFVNRATRCLDLSEVPPTLSERVGLEATVFLKTIVDRISIPPLEEIPNADEMEADELTRWRLPNTEITIAKVPKGTSGWVNFSSLQRRSTVLVTTMRKSNTSLINPGGGWGFTNYIPR